MDETSITVEVVYHYRTAKALLVSTDGFRDEGVWLPLSQIRMDGYPEDLEEGEMFFVTIPEWLAEDKGLA